MPPTNPSDPVSPAPEASAPVPPAPAEAPTPAVPEPVAAPVPQAPVPETAPLQASAPVQTPDTQPVMPAQTAASASVPPATTASSHTGAIVTALILVILLAAGAGAAYYWMEMRSPAAETPQALESLPTAESSPSAIAEANLRSNLEATIVSMNAALTAGSYDDLLKVMGTPEGGKLPTKQQFTDSLEMLRDFLTVDLTKTTFVKAAQDGNVAGYYFTTTEEATQSGTVQTQPSLILSVIKFANDNGTWKITKMYSTSIESSANIEETLSSKEDFRLNPTGTTTPSGTGSSPSAQ